MKQAPMFYFGLNITLFPAHPHITPEFIHKFHVLATEKHYFEILRSVCEQYAWFCIRV